MGTPTATMRLTKPTVGADTGPLWPNELNLDMDLIDRAVNQVITVNIPDQNVTLVADGTTNDQAVYQGYLLTGNLSTSRTVTIPNATRFGRVMNATSGGFNVTLTTGIGSTASLPPNSIFFKYWVDGSGNVILGAPDQFEFVSGIQASGVFLTNNVATDLTTISLTSGDWDVWGSVTFTMGSGSPGAQFVEGWANTVSASRPTLGSAVVILPSSASFTLTSCAIPTQRLFLPATTTVFLSALCLITTGTCKATGYINARRMG